MTQRDPVFPFRQRRPEARVRLLCLPFAGGTAVTYRTWATALPTWIDVCALELPGHGTRLDVPQYTTMEEVLRDLLPHVARLAPPLAIFGHSMGARVGYELCRALETKPIHLFASAAPAPDLPHRRALAQLSRTQLIIELGRMNPASAEALADAELMDLLLPIIRTDLALVESYPGTTAPPLDLPITVLTSTADEDVDLDEAAAWARFTSRPFAAPVVYEGGHFFIDQHAAAIQRLVVDHLDAALRGYGERK